MVVVVGHNRSRRWRVIIGDERQTAASDNRGMCCGGG